MIRRATDFISRDWVPHLGGARTSLGLDVASTKNEKSNPFGLAAMAKPGIDFVVPLEMRWKTDDVRVLDSILETVIFMIPEDQRGCLVVDSSNEKLTAQAIKRKFGHLIRVILVSGNESLVYQGQKWQAKSLLGSLLCNQYEDKRIAIPAEKWIEDDHLLVIKDGPSFEAKIDGNGCHADNFDAEKLALWGHLRGGGVVSATAVNTLNPDESDTSYRRMTPLERNYYLYQTKKRLNS